jgi:hypothetical protein
MGLEEHALICLVKHTNAHRDQLRTTLEMVATETPIVATETLKTMQYQRPPQSKRSRVQSHA